MNNSTDNPTGGTTMQSEIAPAAAGNNTLTHVSDSAADIRSFLAAVRPIPGCCVDDDESFHAGRAAIERIAIAYDKEQEPQLTLSDCANITSYLSSVTAAVDAECPGCSGSDSASGHNRVLEVVSETIKREALASGHDEAIVAIGHAQAAIDMLTSIIISQLGTSQPIDELLSTSKDTVMRTLFGIDAHLDRATALLNGEEVSHG